MKASKQVGTITPTLAKDISFNDKVGEVDTALKSRAAVQREIKTKWGRVVQVLTKYEVKAPGRRVDAGVAATLVQELVVYNAKPKIAPEFQQILDSGNTYALNELASRPNLLRLIDAKVGGLKKFVEDFVEAQAASREASIKDEAKTNEAHAELQAAVDEYIGALESFDDTVSSVASVASVKEYIGIVKDIADIRQSRKESRLRSKPRGGK